MRILSSQEMGAVDRRTAEEFGVPLETLMENAGTAVARFCLRRYPAARRVVALCGKGNNGGDGLVAARVLAAAGVVVEVQLLGREADLRGEAVSAIGRLRFDAPEVVVRELDGAAQLEEWLALATRSLKTAELVVDAIVGTGFQPPLRGVALALREAVAKLTAPVVAVDLPSGWDADSVAMNADGAFRADAVVAFTAAKSAHVFGRLAGSRGGPVVVAQIGSPEEAVCSASGLHWAGSAKTIAEAPRAVDANKGRFGHVLVVGGSYGMAGAPSMAAMAALRAGAGLVTAAVPSEILATVAGFAPELMVLPLGQEILDLTEDGDLEYFKQSSDVLQHEQNAGTLRFAQSDNTFLYYSNSGNALERLLRGISVAAIGPGLGRETAPQEFVRSFVKRASLPMVVDADALNAFAGRAELLRLAAARKDPTGKPRTLVLTPHPGEMARLLGLTVAEVEADRVGLARKFAVAHGLTLVLKGWRTLVAHPDGSVAVNTSGNPAMAKGGSGDVLTGIIAAMLAQYARGGEAQEVARAVESAVYLHGLAGDFAARSMDEHTVLASDTLAHLSDAFRYRTKDADGLTWICGLHPVAAKGNPDLFRWR
ncbi:MAG: NAD(P)H-hydrate dehydratase [Acidobacteriaceae bacterium]|nr:NAD(P)H-hydrate dehydratase [Acidobacteriaceae bacterium]